MNAAAGHSTGGQDFFELVRRLQAMTGARDAVRVGGVGSPLREVLRFRSALDFSFGVGEVDAVVWDSERQRHEVATRFLSLYGTGSPLPACYTELLLYDDPEGRLRAFLDIFNHRLLSLLYRAWEKYRHHVVRGAELADPITKRLRLLSHLAGPGEPTRLLAFAGLLHRQPLSAASLERFLAVYLQVPVAVLSFVIRWVPVPGHQQSALGQRNCSLGGLAVLGRELRSASTTFGVHVGPLAFADYLQFVPGGQRRMELLSLLQLLVADPLDCELVVEVNPQTIRPCCLGAHQGGLGFATWLGESAALHAPQLGSTISRVLERPDSGVKVA